MITKNDLRKHAKKIRMSLDIKTISEKIIENILGLDIYKKAQHVMIFYPIGHEIDLRALLSDKTKTFYLPKVDGENLLVCPYKTDDELKISSFKTEEPTSKPIDDTSILDVIFIPALMVDKNLNRLGYGGGFYDRFLSIQSKKTIKIVAIPSALIVEQIPSDDFDEKIDIQICEN